MTLNFQDFRAANALRQSEWDPSNVIDISYRGNELAGEAGEALERALEVILLGIATGKMSNTVKKLARERLGIRGSRATLADLADELADVVICVDLLAMANDIDLGEAVRKKFNETSEKYALKTRLP